MKKALCFWLFLLTVFLLVSCGKSPSTPPVTTESPTEYVIDAEALLNAEALVNHDCEVHGHVFSKATCQQKATCFYCGVQTGELAAHDWMHPTCLKKRTCTVCGAQTGDYADHLFSVASCAGPASCVYCGLTTGSTPAHRYAAATCIAPSMCVVCMKKQSSALGHIWTGGSCTEPKVCSRCGRKLAAPGHQMTGGSCMTDAVCSVCGYTVKANGHQYDENGICTVCKKSKQQAQKDDLTQVSETANETVTETTTAALELEPLLEYVTSVREHLQSAHDESDAAMSTQGDEGQALARSSVDHLAKALEISEEAIALCKTDARLKSVSDAFSDLSRTIRNSASIQNFYPNTYIRTLMTIRSDSTNGLEAAARAEKAIGKLDN
ncbi:MAG: hypothetical protein IJT44_13180 [Clostridia bacterium]|nr:hypothetical protein [Clostridia bacterium]